MRPREPAAPTSQADMKKNDDILCNLVIPMGAFLIELVCLCGVYACVRVCLQGSQTDKGNGASPAKGRQVSPGDAVSYTHLTLPTILRV